ncbi:MAG: InlB B-repeat-containing protein, partial [Erysipelotrichaceae bacterium]|nr:InlB B-repeat-containing protein [Erysipelotrichaceae bacterium]
KEGFIFTGWYRDPECTVKADNPFILKDHVTLYAGWKVQECTLTFETRGGSALAPVTVPYGQTVDLRNYEPQKRGQTFLGWFVDCECTQKAENQITLKSDTAVYAKWKPRLIQ